MTEMNSATEVLTTRLLTVENHYFGEQYTVRIGQYRDAEDEDDVVEWTALFGVFDNSIGRITEEYGHEYTAGEVRAMARRVREEAAALDEVADDLDQRNGD